MKNMGEASLATAGRGVGGGEQRAKAWRLETTWPVGGAAGQLGHAWSPEIQGQRGRREEAEEMSRRLQNRIIPSAPAQLALRALLMLVAFYAVQAWHPPLQADFGMCCP